MQEETGSASQSIREAVGLFHDHDKMQDAINELEMSGFGRREISVLGSEEAIKKKYGTKHVPPRALEDNPDVPRSSKPKPEEVHMAQGALIGGGVYIGVAAAVVAIGGGVAIPALVTTAAVGGVSGGVVGGLLAKLLGDEYAGFFRRQLESGGLLLWVKTPTREKEERAQKILKEYNAEDVHIHQFTPPTDIAT